MKKAFTMIELIFVIVVLGILSAVAIPRLLGTREDAMITRLRSDVSAIQSGIALKRSENMMKGNMKWEETLGSKDYPFSNVLQNPLKGKWKTENGKDYTFEFNKNKEYKFKYYEKPLKDASENVKIPAGTFTCDEDDKDVADCKSKIGL